jgi:hypothetical protein
MSASTLVDYIGGLPLIIATYFFAFQIFILAFGKFTAVDFIYFQF